MSRCEDHGLDYPDDGECVLCSRKRAREEDAVWIAKQAAVKTPIYSRAELARQVAERAASAPMPESAPDPEPGLIEAATVSASPEEVARIKDEVRRMEAEAVAVPVSVPATETKLRAPGPTEPAVGEFEPTTDSGPEIDPLERFAETVAETNPSAHPGTSEPEMTAARIQELIDKKANVVGLLGFPGAGKTWFLNRLKFELFRSRYDRHEAVPPHAPQWGAVGRTNGITEHYFLCKTLAQRSSFYMIDIPGERFISLAEGRFAERERELLALKACKALIIVMPADEVLLGEQAGLLYSRPVSAGSGTVDLGLEPTLSGKASRRDKLSEQARVMGGGEVRLERFTANMIQMDAALSLLESGTSVATIASMSRDDLVRHLDSDAYRSTTKPIFVALAKADVLERQAEASVKNTGRAPATLMDLLYKDRPTELSMLHEFDRDPERIVDHFRPALASALRGFRWAKFDFVTAFRGHGKAGVDSTVVDYRLARRGVSAVLRWMEWARDADTRLKTADWRAVSAARALRRFRDEGRLTPRKKADQFR